MSYLTILTLPSIIATPVQVEEPLSYEVVQEIEMPRGQIYDHSLLWFTETARSSKPIIELKDKELGTILGNSSTQIIPFKWGLSIPTRFKLRIDVKENRYRLTFSQVMVEFDGVEKPIEQANRGLLEPKVLDKFKELSANLQLYLKNAIKSKSW